ncbi:MAG: hypothetical protein QXF82_10695, partial [Nitrososphaeria archaeon]
KLLKANLLATKHLLILDKIFRERYNPYKDWANKLEQISIYDELRKEIYAGGKKKGKKGYGRHMILGDLIEYILTGRGYYFAIRGEEEFKAFIKILMYISNMLILMEDISVDVELRKVVLEELSKQLDQDFFEDELQKERYMNLLSYEGIIARDEGKEHDIFLDSILPKRVGIVPEILTYCWLIRKNYGYVLPLLLAQRLLGKGRSITPPDFLLIRSKGEIFGLEVGIGKEEQIASFSSITGIPVFTIGIGSVEQPQPYRCDKCLRWITYCPFVIDLCSRNEDKVGEVHLSCESCSYFNGIEDIEAKCPYIVYYGQATNYANLIVQRRYHYHCVKDDPIVVKNLKTNPTEYLVAPIPTVYGIEYLNEEQ